MQIPNPEQVNPLGSVPASVTDDVLHIPAESKLTPEDIAKAVAHHNKHHKDRTEKPAPGTKSGKKPK